MKNILYFIAVLFACCLFCSCQKEPVDPDPQAPPITTQHDSVTRLSQFIFIDTRVSAVDTTGYYSYQYDSLQRVATINMYDYTTGTPSLSAVFTFYYQGSDSLAYKKTEVSVDLTDLYSYSTFYFYDNQQRLIEDSALYGADVNVNKYKYAGTQIVKSGSFIYASDPLNPVSEEDTGFIAVNGNVTTTNSLALDGEYYINNFIFDSHPNPFNQLNIHFTYNPMPGFDFYLYDFMLQKNNALSETEENRLFPGNISSTTYSYTYNALGLPDMVNISDDNGPTDEPRIVFRYKKI
jgi:hypothetical protein